MKRAPGTLTRTRLGPSRRAALKLLACCPRLPTDVVAGLLRMQHVKSAAQLLLRLRTAGLADYEKTWPLFGSRTVRLWTLTPAGHARLALQEQLEQAPVRLFGTNVGSPSLARGAEARCLLPYGRPARLPDVARQRDVPMLVAAYRLLAHVVRGVDRPVRVAAWEHPWIRPLGQSETGRARHVRLPAAAALIQTNASGEHRLRLLLLPDLGTLPVAAYRPVIRRLIELAQSSDTGQPGEPLLIVGVAAGSVSPARVAVWQALLHQVAQRAGEQPLHARVVACPELLIAGGNSHGRSGDQAEQTLGLVARHPLLSRRQLAALLGVSEGRAGQLARRAHARSPTRSCAPLAPPCHCRRPTSWAAGQRCEHTPLRAPPRPHARGKTRSS